MGRTALVTACALLVFATRGVQALRDVRLRVHPPIVVFGRQAALLCEYDLEGLPLYSVKWYRGHLEFFRYSPGDRPPYKVFPFPGIDVDLSSCNATQAVLRRVGFSLAGNFSCEVTADGSFSTKTDSASMVVVALPDGPPILEVDRERYLPGDLLRANCSAPPSKPPAELEFHINGQPVSRRRIELHLHSSTVDGPQALQSSWLTLRARLLPSDFGDHRILSVGCTARLAGLYEDSADLQLGHRPEPVPQRVTALSSVQCACANLASAVLFATIGLLFR